MRRHGEERVKICAKTSRDELDWWQLAHDNKMVCEDQVPTALLSRDFESLHKTNLKFTTTIRSVCLYHVSYVTFRFTWVSQCAIIMYFECAYWKRTAWNSMRPYGTPIVVLANVT